MTTESKATPAGQKESRKDSRKSKQDPLPKDLQGASCEPLTGSKFISLPLIDLQTLKPATKQIFETLFQTEQFSESETREDFLKLCVRYSISPTETFWTALFFAETNGFLADQSFVDTLLKLASITDTHCNKVVPLEGYENYHTELVHRVVKETSG